MSEQIPPEVVAQMQAAALHNPHQLFVIDRVLKVDVGAFTSSLTFGNTAPNGQIIAVATVSTSTAKLREMASGIVAAIDAQSGMIKDEFKAFTALLPKSK
jgi:hypothetical protein